MNLSKSGLSVKQKRCLFIGLPSVLIAFYSLVSFLLYPMYLKYANDILYMYGLIPIILDYLMTFLLYLSLVAIIASVMYAFYRRSKAAIALAVISFVCNSYYYIANLIPNWTKNQASIQTIGKDLLGVLKSVGLDLIIPAAVFMTVLICRFAVKKRRLECNIFTFSHEIVISALAGGAFIAVSRVVQRIIYDVEYGAPNSASEVLRIILAYLIDFVLGFIAYLLIYSIEKFLDKKIDLL